MPSRYRVQHRRITHRGLAFNFFSYDGQPANASRKQLATEPSWFLVNGGYRRGALPHNPDQDVDELDRLLVEWLETNVFAEAGPAPF